MQVKLEYKLQDVQKIKVNVEIVINLHLLMDQEKDD
jgi:hypothetical protein